MFGLRIYTHPREIDQGNLHFTWGSVAEAGAVSQVTIVIKKACTPGGGALA
jgi:hypothetical protein